METKNIKTILYSLFAIALIFLSSPEVFSQGKKRGGGPPPWAPAHGYRAKMNQRHIYYPQQNIYYDRQNEVYIYVNVGRWEVSARLPLPLRNIDLGRAAKVELAVFDDRPFIYNREHRSKYGSMKGNEYFSESD